MYFHTDDEHTITRLARALANADDLFRSVRFNVDDEGNLTYKIGEGGWSAPIASTPDPYRDRPKTFNYRHTHASVNDHSPAMLVRSDLDTITLVNECGDEWTDPVEQWYAI